MFSQRPNFIQLPLLPDVEGLIDLSTSSPEPMFFTAPSSPLGDVSTVSVTAPPDDTPNESFPSPTELPTELDLDDHGLTTLEKIYLFSRSQATFHRLFIARELPLLLQSVSPHDAVEYVLPLLTALALDEDEQVKETFVAELVLVIWWFASNCQLIPVNVDSSPHGPATISVDAFTPILGTLLLSRNQHVNVPARYAVVDLLHRMRRADQLEDGQQIDHDPKLDLPPGLFGRAERALLESEILSQVVVGMGRLDLDQEDEQDDDVFLTPAVDLVASPESSNGSPGSVSTPSTVETVRDSNVNPYFPLLASSSGTSPARSSTSLSSSSSGSQRSTPSSTTGTSASESSSASSLEHFDDSYIPTSNNRDDKDVPSQNNPMSPRMSPPYTSLIGNPTDEFSLRNSFHAQTLLQRAALNLVLPNSSLRIRDASDDEHPTTPENDRLSGRDQVFLPPSAISHPFNLPGPNTPHPEQVFIQANAIVRDSSMSETEQHRLSEEEDSDREQAAVGRLSSMSLMAAVAVSGCLSDSTKQTFVQEVERVALDPVYWVRREACFALGALAKVVPEEVVLISLLPILQSLLQDSSPDVRSSSLFALPAILSRLPFPRRRKLALDTILPMSRDDSPDVRHRVLEALGEVIYTFHDPKNGAQRAADGEEEDEGGGPPEELVQMFLREPTAIDSPSHEPHEGKASTAFHADPSRPLICAFNFPAVTFAVGGSRWRSDLRATYLSLAADSTSTVRQTLAASVGEMAKIIGPENAGEDLFPIWLAALKSDEAEVRIKALECVQVFCQALSLTTRKQVLSELLRAYEANLKSWRERELVAKSLKGLALLAEGSKEVFTTVRALLRNSLWDPINAVREAGVVSVPLVWTAFNGDDEQLSGLRTDIESLAQSQNFRRRVIFIACQQSLILPVPDGKPVVKPDVTFWASLASLANDPITDVRIGLARLVGVACRQLSQEGKVPSGILLDLSRQLSQDTSKEVQSYVPDPFSQAEASNRLPDLHLNLDFRAKPVATFSRPALLQRFSTPSLEGNDL